MAWGDSWLGYELRKWFEFGPDLRDYLVRFRYAVPDKFCVVLEVGNH